MEDPDAGRTFRSRFGQLAPVAVVPGDGSEVVCCPGRDHPVAVGDRVALLATPAELERAGIDLGERSGPTKPAPPVSVRIGRRLAALRRSNAWSLVIVTAGLLALLVVASAVVRAAYVLPRPDTHLSLLESVYFTVETVATSGTATSTSRGGRRGSWPSASCSSCWASCWCPRPSPSSPISRQSADRAVPRPVPRAGHDRSHGRGGARLGGRSGGRGTGGRGPAGGRGGTGSTNATSTGPGPSASRS